MENEPNDVYAKAEDELASIDSQIARLEKRRGELRQFVDLGRKLFDIPASEPTVKRLHRSRQPIHLPDAEQKALAGFVAQARDMSLKGSILKLSRDAIEARGPMHTRELVAYIEGTGVEVTGADKITTVSVVLSRSEDFVSSRATGWSLKEKTPQDVAASTGSTTA